MSKAKIPVSVEGIEFDALISEELTLEATVPAYAVEDGYSVSDTIILNPERLQMVLYVTDTPVTWIDRHGRNRVKKICQQLERLFTEKKIITVRTTDKTYTNMVIESITISKTIEEGYAREIPISFSKVMTTSTRTTTIPDSYGKSGATAATAGTAGTSTGTTSGGGSSGGSYSSSGGGSSNSNGGNSGSILYNLGKNAGFW